MECMTKEERVKWKKRWKSRRKEWRGDSEVEEDEVENWKEEVKRR